MIAAGTLRRVAVQWTVTAGIAVVEAVVKPFGVPNEKVARVSIAVVMGVVAGVDAAWIVVAAAAPTVGIHGLSGT
jgi:hypothetical protein